MEPVIVTADVAQRWQLRQRHHCHPGQSASIARYAREMRAGLRVHHPRTPIVFSDRGELLDGRCRVAAAVIAGVPVALYVVGWHFGPFPLEEEDIA